MSHRPSNLIAQVEAQILLTTVAGRSSMVWRRIETWSSKRFCLSLCRRRHRRRCHRESLRVAARRSVRAVHEAGRLNRGHDDSHQLRLRIAPTPRDGKAGIYSRSSSRDAQLPAGLCADRFGGATTAVTGCIKNLTFRVDYANDGMSKSLEASTTKRWRRARI